MNNESKIAHIDIAQNPNVKEFLEYCSFMREPNGEEIDEIVNNFEIFNIKEEKLPNNLITIASSSYEASIHDNIPFTNIGYVKLVTSLLKYNDIKDVSKDKFIDPFKLARITDENESLVFVLPSCNIKYKDTKNTKESFRLALDEFFENFRDDINDRKTSLKETLFWLFSYRKINNDNKIILHKCPTCGHENVTIQNIEESQFCPHCENRIFATDCLRLYEELDEHAISNKGVLGRFEKVIKHIYLGHLLRMIKIKNKNTYLQMLKNIGIIIDGPLMIAGTAAWVHKSLMKVIYEINVEMRSKRYNDLLIIGLLKESSIISSYAQLISQHLENNSLLCISDEFREKYITFNKESSGTTFGNETYYGQDFLWKHNNSVFSFNLPYYLGTKENVEKFKIDKCNYLMYNNLNIALLLLSELKSDINTTSIIPLVLSQSYTMISMEPGAKVLDLLSKNNII